MRFYIALFLFCCSLASFAQEDTTKSGGLPADADYRYLLMDDESAVEFPVFKPVIGLGYGVITFFGDVNDIYNSSPVVGRNALNFSISRRLSPSVNITFNLISGKLSGIERSSNRNLNFQTDILNIGANVEYNFRGLMKKTGNVMPFISLGMESFEFNSKGDLYDANDNLYYYWSDGTLRNIEEDPVTAHTSIILQRDYRYETDLRELDLDGLGDYPQVAFAMPITAGVDMKVTDRLDIRLGVSYHMILNDLVDNVSKNGEDIRKGTKQKDKFLYSYLTFKFDLFSPPPLTIEDKHYMDVDFVAIDLEDEDNDHIKDIDDKCPGTPLGIKVNDYGCPFDADDDGIPDFRDDEKESAKNAIVNLRGVTMTEDEIIAMVPKGGLKRSEMYDYYPSLREGPKKFTQYYIEIPEKFKNLDTDKDDYISLDELLQAVDDFFDMKSDYTIDDIYELNDFFFDQ
ncbi:MAG: hypothetical protein A2W91_20380 [Bacteroidetes bacterium GWF2_38_335]|nr:MAG: hypothetical protein A2W91_20380 [Bacteroidetes bacterium GWF2_38_335]OFY79483.1 MAG: hypothetical protein A2281_13705 [Bacteroidetes bacterium RIFOXYA12_FULL_38_20]HBS86580.1 hypothetical protein [Bacteroidales bacterium]